MKLIGTKIHVESGGIIVSDFLDIVVDELIVDDSATIHANYKVIIYYFVCVFLDCLCTNSGFYKMKYFITVFKGIFHVNVVHVHVEVKRNN